jgi:hypothetical protein
MGTIHSYALSDGTYGLASERCVPCSDAKPFTVEEASERLKDLPGWALKSLSSIRKAPHESFP